MPEKSDIQNKIQSRIQERRDNYAQRQEDLRQRMQAHREVMIQRQRELQGRIQLRRDTHRHLLNNYRMIRRTFFAQFISGLLTCFASSLGPLVDGIVIGRYMGSGTMAAYGIIAPITVLLVLAGAMTATGARNRFTHFVGRGEIPEAQGVFTLSFLLSLGLGAAMMAVILPLAEPIAGLLGASGNAASLLPEATKYLIGLCVGMPGLNVYWVMYDFMMVDNDQKMPIIASAVASAVNIVLDLLIVTVLHGGLFEMGLATSISNYAGALTYFLHFRRKNRIVRFRFRGLRLGEALQILRYGIPSIVSRVTQVLNTALINRLMAMLAAAVALAALSVQRQAISFTEPISEAAGNTVALLAGILMSEEDRPMMQKMFVIFFTVILAITIPLAILGWFAAPWFAGLYIQDDPEAYRMAVDAVHFMALALPISALNQVYLEYINGIGKSRLASIAVLVDAAIEVLTALLLSRFMGVHGVWVSFLIAQVLMTLFYTGVIVAYHRRMKDIPLVSWDSLFLLPVQFDVPPEDRIDLSITDIGEVMDLSLAVWQFCEEHGCDERRKYIMSLSVEEMAGRAMRDEESDGRRHSVNVRILKKGEDYILRVRDDYAVFDPLEQIQYGSVDRDPDRHMGLRMIHSMAQEIRYTCILKLNNLFVRI